MGRSSLILGGYGISYPQNVLQWVGLDLLSTNRPAGLVEARAVYGGLFLVMGAFTLWTTIAPRAHRGELTLLACLWLGLFTGRIVGVSIDGNPGLLNTLAAVFELIMGGLLLAAPYLPNGEETTTPEPAQP